MWYHGFEPPAAEIFNEAKKTYDMQCRFQAAVTQVKGDPFKLSNAILEKAYPNLGVVELPNEAVARQ